MRKIANTKEPGRETPDVEAYPAAVGGQAEEAFEYGEAEEEWVSHLKEELVAKFRRWLEEQDLYRIAALGFGEYAEDSRTDSRLIHALIHALQGMRKLRVLRNLLKLRILRPPLLLRR